MNRIKIGAAGLALALTAIIVPAAANAEEPLIVEGVIEQPVIYVSYADLNLANEAGVARLNRRVRTAATRLCMQNGFQGVTQEMRDHACRADALTNAGRQIDIAVANFGKSQYAAASGKTIAVALR